MSENYYTLLNVSQDADLETINEAYRKIRDYHHPNKYHLTQKAIVQSYYDSIEQAYQTISNPRKRERYNQDLHKKNKSLKAFPRWVIRLKSFLTGASIMFLGIKIPQALNSNHPAVYIGLIFILALVFIWFYVKDRKRTSR